MQRPLNAGAVVVPEIADPVDHELKVGVRNLFVAEHDFAPGIAGFRQPPEVHDDLKQPLAAALLAQFFLDAWGQRIEQQVQVVRDDLFEWKRGQ